MTQFLPPNLLALFAARDPLPFLPPVDKLPHEKQHAPFTGISAFLSKFEDTKGEYLSRLVENRDQKQERKKRERLEQHAYKLEQDLALWDPLSNPSNTTDPYKTLFIARVNYDTSESKLRREFEVFGPIRKIVVVTARSVGKPRGYAFIEYEHERDMHSGYKHADGRKIDGRRVLVDVERGRTVKGWRPRRLAEDDLVSPVIALYRQGVNGGGLGGTRKGGHEENTRFSGRDDYSSGPGSTTGHDEPSVSNAKGSRERSRSRERRRRSRSRSMPRRERNDRERPRRSRSKDRGRGREERVVPEGDREDDDDRREKRRSHGSKQHERRRSRSRDRKRNRRSKSRDRGQRSGEPRVKEEPNVTLEPPFGNDGSTYNFREAGGDANFDSNNVRVKKEPEGRGYPDENMSQMNHAKMVPPPS